MTYNEDNIDNNRLSDRILNEAKAIRFERYGKRQDISKLEEEQCVKDAAQRIKRELDERRKHEMDRITPHLRGRQPDGTYRN